LAPNKRRKNTHSNSIAGRISRARRKRQRLPSSLLIENVSDRPQELRHRTLPEAFPIKPSDNPAVIRPGRELALLTLDREIKKSRIARHENLPVK